MYRHILVPTDGSELSNAALREAARFAKSIGADITVLYVQQEFPNPPLGDGAALGPLKGDFVRASASRSNEILEAASVIVTAEGVACRTRTGVSDAPWQVIIRTAEFEGCDLVFMASHGRRGLVGLVIGSETHKVLTHCKIPVLVYR